MRFVLALILLLMAPSTLYAADIVLTWTAPADDEGLPSESDVTHYVLMYSTAPITEANFDSATQIPTTTPEPRGDTETYNVTLPDGHYYFALKSYDVVGNESLISNVSQRDFLAPSPVTDLL